MNIRPKQQTALTLTKDAKCTNGRMFTDSTLRFLVSFRQLFLWPWAACRFYVSKCSFWALTFQKCRPRRGKRRSFSPLTNELQSVLGYVCCHNLLWRRRRQYTAAFLVSGLRIDEKSCFLYLWFISYSKKIGNMASNKTKTTQFTSVIIQKCFWLFGFTVSWEVVVWCECCCFCAVE